MHRRHVLHTAIAVGGASLLDGDCATTAETVKPPLKIVDTNVNLFQWPFRRLPLDQTDALVKKLRSLGVIEAWAGSYEGILHRDVSGVNERLAKACERIPELVPVGSVNLELPGWEDDVRACFGKFEMPGVRLHPNYHGYTLADPRFQRLLKSAASAGRFVQIAVAMEDTRTQHPMLRAEDVDLEPLPDVLRACAGARVQILNARLHGGLLAKLAKTPGVYFDIARVDGTDGVANLWKIAGPGRVMFGSGAPFLIPEASMIRIAESNLGDEDLQALLWTGAGQIRKPHTR